MREKINFLPEHAQKDYSQCFPLELPWRADLEKTMPNPEWAKAIGISDSHLAQRKNHGFGHIARIIIYESLLMPKLEERLRKEGVVISQEQKAALRLSEETHDLGYQADYQWILGNRLNRHQERGADPNWLEHVFNELREKGADLFQDVLPSKVINLASQINRVHDYRDDSVALRILQKEYDPNLQNLPLELEIFKDLDAGLERLRAQEWIKRRPAVEIMVRVLKGELLDLSSAKSPLHRFHFPHFEETRELLPFAIQLYHQSIKNPEYKIDQWKTTIDTAQILGAVRS